MDKIEELEQKLEAIKQEQEKIKQMKQQKPTSTLSDKDVEEILEAIQNMDYIATATLKTALMEKQQTDLEADTKANELMDKYREKERKFMKMLDKKLGLG